MHRTVVHKQPPKQNQLTMAFQLFVLAAVLAAANAGYVAAPAAYAAPAYAAPAYAAPAYAAPAYAAPVVAKAVPAAVTSQSANILRSYGNLGQVSTYTKTIDTPYSSVSKSDVRVSNPGYATYAAPAYHAPVVHAAPAVAAYHAPAPVVARVAAPAYAAPAYAAPAYAAPVAKVAAAPSLLGVAYSAAPVVAHMSYSNSYGIQYAY